MPGHYGHGGKKKPKGGKKGGKKWQMGNSPVDKSKDFIKSGMTLITEMNSDRYLKKTDMTLITETNSDLYLKKKGDKRQDPGQTRWYYQGYMATNLSSAGK